MTQRETLENGQPCHS